MQGIQKNQNRVKDGMHTLARWPRMSKVEGVRHVSGGSGLPGWCSAMPVLLSCLGWGHLTQHFHQGRWFEMAGGYDPNTAVAELQKWTKKVPNLQNPQTIRSSHAEKLIAQPRFGFFCLIYGVYYSRHLGFKFLETWKLANINENSNTKWSSC